jgi:hypothetical protein
MESLMQPWSSGRMESVSSLWVSCIALLELFGPGPAPTGRFGGRPDPVVARHFAHKCPNQCSR